MTPRLITSNGTLHDYIPNVVTEVEGEDTLFDKLTPDILLAEEFIEHSITAIELLTGTSTTAQRMLELARKICAYKSFIYGVPKLDIILTANGFGIVSNGNTAPASKERVERLITSLSNEVDDAIDHLIRIGMTDPIWREDPQGGKKHQKTIFSSLEAQRMQGISTNLWEEYQKQLPAIQRIEDYIARNYISEEFLNYLREYNFTNITGAKAVLQSRLKPIIVAMLKDDNKHDDRELRDLVDYIRKNDTLYAEWKSTYAGTRFQDHSFTNNKNAGAFWL